MSKLHRYLGVSCALIHDGKILVVRRSLDDDFLAGYYELPGGKLDPGETEEDAIRREMAEEVGLRVEPVKRYRKFEYQAGPNSVGTDLEYLVRLADGEDIEKLKLSDEHDDYKWVSPDDLSKLARITPEKVEGIKQAFANV